MPAPAKASRRAAKSPARTYRAVAERLSAEIAAGRRRVGERLPTEQQLAAQLGVSRSTVRAALALLEKQGMVARKPKVGTLVKACAPASRYAVAVGSISELLVFLDSTLVTPVDAEEVAAAPALAAELRCAPGTRWIRVRTLRTPAEGTLRTPAEGTLRTPAEGTLRTPKGGRLPISWTEYYLQPRFRGVVAQIGKRAGPVYPLLERRYGAAIERMEQDIGACAMPAAIARRLSTPAASPALRVIHRMVSAVDGTLYCTISLYPADRFRYVQALRRTA